MVSIVSPGRARSSLFNLSVGMTRKTAPAGGNDTSIPHVSHRKGLSSAMVPYKYYRSKALEGAFTSGCVVLCVLCVLCACCVKVSSVVLDFDVPHFCILRCRV